MPPAHVRNVSARRSTRHGARFLPRKAASERGEGNPGSDRRLDLEDLDLRAAVTSGELTKLSQQTRTRRTCVSLQPRAIIVKYPVHTSPRSQAQAQVIGTCVSLVPTR